MQLNKIRIVHLLKNLEIGGIERSTINLSNNLTDELDLVIIWAEKGILSQLIKKSVKLKLILRNNRIASPFFFLYNFYRLLDIVRSQRVNVVHYHFRIFLPYVLLIKLFHPDIKVIYTHHNVFNDFITRFLYADYYIAISKVTEAELKKNKKNCFFIKHGIELQPEKNIFKKEGIKNIGYVGRFNESKGIFTLLRAFHSLTLERNDLKLFLFGEGEQKAEIVNFINKNTLNNFVYIYPPSSDLSNIYSKIDLLILPSIKLEGFGLVLIEAMSFGIPVIVSDLPVFKETITNNENGLIFERNNLYDLIMKITELIENNNLRNKIIANAKLKVMENSDLKKMCDEYIELYTKL